MRSVGKKLYHTFSTLSQQPPVGKMDNFKAVPTSSASQNLAVGSPITKPSKPQALDDAVATSTVQTHDLEMKMASVKKVWDAPATEPVSSSSTTITPSTPATDDSHATVMATVMASIGTFSDPIAKSKFTAANMQRTAAVTAGLQATVGMPSQMPKVSTYDQTMLSQMQAKSGHIASYPSRVGAVGSAAHQQISSSSPPVVMSQQINSPPLDNMRQTINAYMSAAAPGHAMSNMAARPIYGSQHAVAPAAANLYQHFGHQMDPMHAFAQVFAQASNHTAYGSHMNAASHQAVTNQAGMYGIAGQQVQATQPVNDHYRNQLAASQMAMKTQLQHHMQQSMGMPSAAAAYYQQAGGQAAAGGLGGYYAQHPTQQQQAYGYPSSMAPVGAQHSQPTPTQQSSYRNIQQQQPIAVGGAHGRPSSVEIASSQQQALRSAQQAIQGQIRQNQTTYSNQPQSQPQPAMAPGTQRQQHHQTQRNYYSAQNVYSQQTDVSRNKL